MDEMNTFENAEPLAETTGMRSGSGKSKLDSIKDTVADKLHSAAAVIKEKAEENEGSAAVYAGQAGQWLDGAAGYIREVDPQQLKTEIQNEVRRHPGRSLLIAGAAGLLLGVMLRR